MRSIDEWLGFGTDEELILKKIEQWANERGEKTFIYYGEEDESYTYERFNALANCFANHLIELGVNKGDRISLFLKNSLITTIAMFGIWKAGAVYCPINFNYRGKLLSYQINDTKPKILITERQMVSRINEIKHDIPLLTVIIHDPKPGEHDYQQEAAQVQLDEMFTTIAFDEMTKGNAENPNIDLHYYDTANIIYTSGTTGPAKGVVQSYRWMHGYTYISRAFCNEEDVIYNDLPMYHVGGAFSLVLRGAFVGCKVALWDKFSPNDFWRRINVSGATNATLLDVMIPWLMKAEPSERDRYNPLKKVHMQPLPKYHHEVAKRFGFDFVTSGFGQTESGNGFSSLIVELEEGEGTPDELYKGYSRKEMLAIAERLNIPIIKGNEPLAKGFMGFPSPHMVAEILNEHDEECEVGEVGQIAFRTRYPHLLMKEYFNKPQATVEVFQNLWFHTGDTGYKDEHGYFYFVDRMNDVIRTRGENVSSYQVEDLMNQHEHVRMCAAFPIPAEEGEEDDIVVYVVPKSDKLTVEELMEWAKREMPKFMWPKHIRLIEDLPRTPTNKIEKYKLKEQILKELNKI